MSSGAPQEFWPLRLSKDIAELGIWSIEYDSAPTLWRGHSTLSTSFRHLSPAITKRRPYSPICQQVHTSSKLHHRSCGKPFWQLPFDSASIPLADDASSLNERRKAIDLYEQTATFASALGCTRISNDASDKFSAFRRLRIVAARPNRNDLPKAPSCRVEIAPRDSQACRNLPFCPGFGLFGVREAGP